MDYLVFLLIAVGVIILIMYLQFLNSRNSDKIYIQKLNRDFGNKLRSDYNHKRLSHAQGYFKHHKEYGQLDEITWADLSMDDFFADIDTTQSDIGCEVLYHILRSPLTDANEIKSRQSEISYWIKNPELRNRILICLFHMGWLSKCSVYDHLEEIRNDKNTNYVKYLCMPALLLLPIGFMYISKTIGIIAFIAVLTYNMFFYYRTKTSIGPGLLVFDHVLKIMSSAEDIYKILSDNSEKLNSESIKNNLDKLKAFKRNNGIIRNFGGEGNQFSAIFSIFDALFFIDVIRFIKMKNILAHNIEAVDGLIYEIGKIDAYISMAGYVAGKGDMVCIPNFADSGYTVRELYHPLLTSPVTNDLVTTKSILLTGSNASGKSTLLKAVALSVIMAQTFGYVCAKEYCAPIYLLASSMSLKDDICLGDSYYMAEIKAVKRIIDVIPDADIRELKVICFVDELLRGTNTIERIAASSQIIQFLDKAGAFVCAATHDLELTELLKNFNNYHFEEDLTDGDVRFSYEIKAGPACSRNAIRLLKHLNYDENITSNAMKMVENYEENGFWTMEVEG